MIAKVNESNGSLLSKLYNYDLNLVDKHLKQSQRSQQSPFAPCS